MEKLKQSTVYIVSNRNSVIIIILISESLPTHNIVFQGKLMHIYFSSALYPCLQHQKVRQMFMPFFSL